MENLCPNCKKTAESVTIDDVKYINCPECGWFQAQADGSMIVCDPPSSKIDLKPGPAEPEDPEPEDPEPEDPEPEDPEPEEPEPEEPEPEPDLDDDDDGIGIRITFED